MKTPKWIMPDGKAKVTSHSGGEGTQLGGYDARNRTIANPNGANRTPDIISEPGKNVPTQKQEPKISKGIPPVNSGPTFRSGADLPALGWKRKGYSVKQKSGNGK